MPFSTRKVMSLRAVSSEQLHILAHLEDFSLPSKPSHSILIILVCRSFIGTGLHFSQKTDFSITLSMTDSVESKTASRHFKNNRSHSVMSRSPFLEHFII